MILKTKSSMIALALNLGIISIIILLSYLNIQISWLFGLLALFLGFGIILFVRYSLGQQYPHEYGKFHNPDEGGYYRLVEMLEEGDRLDIVMGEINPNVLTPEVCKAIDTKISSLKDFRLRLIISPKIHTDSVPFLEMILKHKEQQKVQLSGKNTRPVRHFRLLYKKKLFIEPPHKPFASSKYLAFDFNPSLEKKYINIFEEYLDDSKPISSIDDISKRNRITPEDIDYLPYLVASR